MPKNLFHFDKLKGLEDCDGVDSFWGIQRFADRRDAEVIGEYKQPNVRWNFNKHGVQMILAADYIHIREHVAIGSYLSLQPLQTISFGLDLVDGRSPVKYCDVRLVSAYSELRQHHRCAKRMPAKEDIVSQRSLINILVPKTRLLQDRKRRIKQATNWLHLIKHSWQRGFLGQASKQWRPTPTRHFANHGSRKEPPDCGQFAHSIAMRRVRKLQHLGGIYACGAKMTNALATRCRNALRTENFPPVDFEILASVYRHGYKVGFKLE